MDAHCVDPFLASLEPLVADNGPFQDLKQQGFELLKRQGLPVKNTPGWRHLSLRHLLTKRFIRGVEGTVTKEQIAPALLPSCQRSYVVFVNGRLDLSISDLSGFSPAVMVSSLESGFDSHYLFLQTRFKEFLKKEYDPFALLNFALQERGAFIYVPAHIHTETPLQILYVSSAATAQVIAPKIEVVVGAHSQLSLFVSTLCLGEDVHLQLPHLDLFCDRHSSCALRQCINGQTVMQSLRAVLKESAQLSSVSLNEGGILYRSSYHVHLKEERANVHISGLSCLKESQVAHIHGIVEHEAPETESMQLFKSVQQGVSRSSFSGKIKVAPEAQKTQAYQLNNTLLLSPHATVLSEPNLEIRADDVKASHGATISQLREEDLFYCASRGIDAATGKRLLIDGFCASILSEFPLNIQRTYANMLSIK
jgi:Fe-S cluster assembly protein SufD